MPNESIRDIGISTAIELGAIPVTTENGAVEYLTDTAGNTVAQERFTAHFGVEAARERVVTRSELFQAIQEVYDDSLTDTAVYSLYRRRPEYSAYRVFSKLQLVIVFFLIAGLAACAWFFPAATFRGVFLFIQLVYVLFIFYKFYLSIHGSIDEILVTPDPTAVEAGREIDYPVYTVLVPLYREANIVPQLLAGLSRIDYPKENLDIILLLEADDTETIETVKASELPPYVAALIVPKSYPKTKPKACNYGLLFARGEYLVIFDAEDVPEPDQLKKAVLAFQENSTDYICFQGMLNYYNSAQNLLTRMFTLEYSYWFDYILPGLHKLKLPIPLGGTSNHFKTASLRGLGGWDPYNTTEDADLGVRIAAEGFDVGVILSTTFEEANSRIGNFIKQRTRWIKGYMQTYLVYMRQPIKLLRSIGFKGWLSFHLFVGGTPAIFLLNLLMYIFTIGGLVVDLPFRQEAMTPVLLYLAFTNLLLGNFIAIYMNMLGAFRRRNYRLILLALLNPVYWVLHSLAAYRALWQLLVKPHYWDKTKHFATPQTSISELPHG